MAAVRTAPSSVACLLAATLGGCAENLPGHYFTVELTTSKDQANQLQNDCQDPPEAIKETWEYRVVLEGPSARVYIGPDLMAAGTLDVCALSYTSITWQTRHGDGDVRWAVVGDADVGIDAGCPEGWEGSERLEVVASSDPDVPESCSVTFDVKGTYDGEVP